MKDITITGHGLRIEGRAILPGSRLVSSADFPAHFSRFSEPTGEGRIFEVATPVDELETARADYEELFGKKPHHRMALETIREAISAELEK